MGEKKEGEREAEKKVKRDGRLGSRWWEYGREEGGGGEWETEKKRKRDERLGSR
jgi:hypothetical protein